MSRPRVPLGIALLVLALSLVLAVVGGVAIGAVTIPPDRVLAALTGSGTPTETAIILSIRLPRVIAAALVGAALAVAGGLLQGLTRNPLADPYVTGTSAGGVLGAVFALAFLGPGLAATIPLAAFVGALIAVAAVWQLARLGGRTTVLTLLLAGIVLSSFAGAVVTLLLLVNDRLALRVRAVLDVLVGAVSIRDGAELAVAAAIVVVGIAAALVLAPSVDAYAFGEETAATLGVDTDRATAMVLAATALLAGAGVALAGLVGFVGLVIPHAVRAVVGAAHRRLLATSALAGATGLVLADLGSRTALAPTELPVGVITGLVGAPFFLVILVRSRRRMLA